MELLLFDTPLGTLGLGAEEDTLVQLYLPHAVVPDLASRETPLLRRGKEELLEYLAGDRQAFDLPLRPMGTPFQQRVWHALCEIPYGDTRSYGALAAAIGSPRACRAVGMANHRNPLPILIPCHRVIGATGALVGYGGGLAVKEALLLLERS